MFNAVTNSNFSLNVQLLVDSIYVALVSCELAKLACYSQELLCVTRGLLRVQSCVSPRSSPGASACTSSPRCSGRACRTAWRRRHGVRRPAPRAAPWPAEETGSRSLRVLVNSRYRQDFICIFVCRGGRVVSLFHSVGVISHVDWSKRASP